MGLYGLGILVALAAGVDEPLLDVRIFRSWAYWAALGPPRPAK